VRFVCSQLDDHPSGVVAQTEDRVYRSILGDWVLVVGHGSHDRRVARVVLLLPTATYRAPDFLSAAARLGVEVVVASEQAPVLAHAMGDRALEVDLQAPDDAAAAIVELDRRFPVDGIVAVDEQGVVVAALAAERLGLRHNPPDAVRATRNKAEMRARLSDAEVQQPYYRVLEKDDDVAAAVAAVGLPCVIKPLSLSASRGVIRADSVDEARAAVDRVRTILDCAGEDRSEALLVESFVPGDEVAVEGLLRGGELEILAVFDKPDPLVGPYFEETIYVTPSRHPAQRLVEVETAVAAATTALGLTEGPVHAEVRLPPDGPVAVLEVAARSIGGLCARTLRFGTGASLEELILRHGLDLPAGDSERERLAAGVMMLPTRQTGVLRAVHGREEALAVPGIVELDIAVPLGRQVQPLPEGDRYLGFLFARASTPAEVEAALRAAHAELDIVIEAE
jgi:biotin carboxylase